MRISGTRWSAHLPGQPAGLPNCCRITGGRSSDSPQPAQRARSSDAGREVRPDTNAGLSVAVIGTEIWELLQARPQPKPGRCAYGQPQQDDENGTDSTGWLRALRLHPVVRLDAALCKDFGWQELDG